MNDERALEKFHDFDLEKLRFGGGAIAIYSAFP
jgi:hypothetical protein